MSFFISSPAAQRSEQGSANLASPHFTTAETPRTCTTVELTVRDLGFPHEAITATIYTKAAALGLRLCPLELGPHFRLHDREQPAGDWGQPVRQHQAPSGSITIATITIAQGRSPLTMTFPKAFTCAACRASCGCAAIGLG